MSREVGAVLLVLVGGAILRISIGDTYLRYVKEGLRPWLLVSGTILLLLGLWAVVDLVREARAADRAANEDRPDGGIADTHDHDGHEAHDHEGHGAPRAAWLLVLPVLAIFLVAPPALGAFTAERQPSTVSAPAQTLEDPFPPLPPGDVVALEVSDYSSRAVWDSGRTLEGRTVQMTGFVSSAPDGGWYLTRLGLNCCAADAFAVKIEVVEAPSQPPVDTWVTVTGQWVPGGGVESPDAIPRLRIVDLVEVPVPDEPYEQ